MNSLRRRWALMTATAAACLALTSCGKGDGRKPTFSVVGQVFVDQKPAANAEVVFHPVGDPDPNAVKPHGTVGADGTFTLTTYDGGDGAPAGDYRVTVELYLAGKADEPPKDRLYGRYAKPETSKLGAKVNAAATTLPKFELTSR